MRIEHSRNNWFQQGEAGRSGGRKWYVEFKKQYQVKTAGRGREPKARLWVLVRWLGGWRRWLHKPGSVSFIPGPHSGRREQLLRAVLWPPRAREGTCKPTLICVICICTHITNKINFKEKKSHMIVLPLSNYAALLTWLNLTNVTKLFCRMKTKVCFTDCCVQWVVELMPSSRWGSVLLSLLLLSIFLLLILVVLMVTVKTEQGKGFPCVWMVRIWWGWCLRAAGSKHWKVFWIKRLFFFFLKKRSFRFSPERYRNQGTFGGEIECRLESLEETRMNQDVAMWSH